MFARLERFLRAVLLGGIVFGPILRYAAGVVEFGCGLVSSFAITTYAWDTLAEGAVIGLVSAALDTALPNRRWTVAWVTGGAVALRWILYYVFQAVNTGLTFDHFVHCAFYVVCHSAAGVLTGYFTVRVADTWTAVNNERKAAEAQRSHIHQERYEI